MDIMRQKLKGFKETLVFGLSMLSPANVKKQIRELKQKTYPELFVGFFKLFFYFQKDSLSFLALIFLFSNFRKCGPKFISK